jgi:hypothetical protein
MWERMTDKDGTVIYPSRSVASKLHVGRNTMIKALRERKILDRDNLPVKPDRRYYRAHVNDAGRMATYYTEEGVEFLFSVLSDLPKKIDRSPVDTDLPLELIELLNT